MREVGGRLALVVTLSGATTSDRPGVIPSGHQYLLACLARVPLRSLRQSPRQAISGFISSAESTLEKLTTVSYGWFLYR